MRYKNLLVYTLATALTVLTQALWAADYVIDTKKAHAFIQFKISHLGYSWVLGRFNEFNGNFSYDEGKPTEAKVEVIIKTASIDSNHAERDKHLRGKDFLEVDKYPEAKFVSTAFTKKGENKATLTGNFTFHGITKPLTIDVIHIGAGPDPWGGQRRGFEGHAKFALKDFGIDYDLGPTAQEVELFLSIEGVRQVEEKAGVKR